MTFKLPASLLLGLLIADSAFLGLACQVKPTDAGDAAVVGDWRGDSICVVRESACHDEDSFYHVKRLPEKPGWFSVKFDKLVSGRPITMGTQECSYDSAKQVLLCEISSGRMQFKVQGSKMEGTMNLSDGRVWRKISLNRAAR